MAQDKEEVAIPGDAAPDDAQPNRDIPTAEAGAPLQDDTGPTEPESEALPEPANAGLDESKPEPVEDSSSEAAPEADPTKSSEAGNGEVFTFPAAPKAPGDESKTIRRILPARPATPAALSTSTFATKTPWTPLRKLTVCVIGSMRDTGSWRWRTYTGSATSIPEAK